MRRLTLVGTIVAALAVVTAAVAATPADEAVTRRQAIFKQMQKATKSLQEVLDGDIKDRRAEVTAQAHLIRTLARQPWNDFGKETAQTHLKTRTLPLIWTQSNDWKAAEAKFIAAADALDAAADGSPDLVRQRATALAGTCRDCHKAFKSK